VPAAILRFLPFFTASAQQTDDFRHLKKTVDEESLLEYFTYF